MKILALNAGSSSVRLGAYEGVGTEHLWSWHAKLSEHSPEESLRQVLEAESSGPFDAAVHRLVHGGQTILGPTFADEQSKAAIETLIPLAPLHNEACLTWLKAAEQVLGPHTRQIVVPDTGFYVQLPARASRYALPATLRHELGVRRFGFHGLAHESMVRGWHSLVAPADPENTKLISLQLGSGCSITATKGKTPVDTSMGYTPLEGLVMATRAGDLDPGIVLRLLEAGFDRESLVLLLNRDSGLRGLSGFSGDMQALLASASAEARTAIEVYCYRARKYVGAYMAALGGVDAILFGGGVGENSPEIRARILDPLSWCGIEIDDDRNQRIVSESRRISSAQSVVAVWVIKVDEERLMAEAAYGLLQA